MAGQEIMNESMVELGVLSPWLLAQLVNLAIVIVYFYFMLSTCALVCRRCKGYEVIEWCVLIIFIPFIGIYMARKKYKEA